MKNTNLMITNMINMDILIVLGGIIFAIIYFMYYEYEYYNCSYTLTFICIFTAIYISYKLLIKQNKTFLDNLIIAIELFIFSFHSIHLYYKYYNLYDINI